MPRFLIAVLMLVVVASCSAQPTTTPTPLPPTPTETAVPPTETPIPPSATIVPTAVPPTATPTQVPITGTAKATLNVRETPSLTAKLLGTLKKGDDVTLIAISQDKKWFEINYPLDSNSNAWVLLSLVQPGEGTDVLPTLPGQVESATPTAAATKIAVSATVTLTAAATKIAVSATVTLTTSAKPTATSTLQPTAASGAPPGSIIFDTFQNGTYQLNQVRADGTGLKVLFTGASEPALSPDGRTLAYQKRKGAGTLGLWISNLDGSSPAQVVSFANAGYPTWSSDGNNLAYNLAPNGPLPNQIWRVARDGSNAVEIGVGVRPAWQPGGSSTVIFDGCDGNGANCYSLYTENAFKPDVNNPTVIVRGVNAAWSPNGSQVAFQETDSSGINVYVANRDGSNKRAVTKDAGHSGDPIWSSDGQWIFYRSDKSGVWALHAIRVDGTSDRQIVEAPVDANNWDFEKLAIGP